jgi:hypothetical protein
VTSRSESATPAVSRSYQPEAANCVRAVELLLEKPLISNEGGPETAPENARKESDELSRNTDST